MRVVSVSDYAIKHRVGVSIPTRELYVTRAGNTRHRIEFKEYYKTNMGEFAPKEWLETALQIIQAVQETKLLEEIKGYVKKNCLWLKSEKEIEEYSVRCLISGTYMYWEEFPDKRWINHKVFLFELNDWENMDRRMEKE